jgi:hypothetical protein
MGGMQIGCENCDTGCRISLDYSGFKETLPPDLSIKNIVWDERDFEDTPFYVEDGEVYCKKCKKPIFKKKKNN